MASLSLKSTMKLGHILIKEFCFSLRIASFSVKVSSNQVNGGTSKKFPCSKFLTLVVRNNFPGF